MRQVGFLGQGADEAAALGWLETLRETGVTRMAAGQTIPPGTGTLWLHGDVPTPPGLLEWVREGGRLLATLEAAALPVEMGLEPDPPDRLVAEWRHADDEFWLEEFKSFQAFPHVRGLAGFGPHPLFEGLHQGAYTWAPSEGEPFTRLAYTGRRPRGGVVAMERSFIHLNPDRVIAWEHDVGDGGILCIGGYIHPAAPDRLLARQVEALLANAITGDAIPHRDRAMPVSLWPGPGRRAIRQPSVPVPEVTGLEGKWVESVSDLALHGPAADDAPWTLAGRRMLLTGSESVGLLEAWSHPVRIVRDATVSLAGQTPLAQTVRVAPEEVTRTLVAGRTHASEKWTTGIERPVLLWEIVPERPAAVCAGWTVDLRRMWPYPEGAWGDLAWNWNGSDRAWIGATGGSVQVVFQVMGGRFAPPVEGPGLALRLEAHAEGPLRIVAVAATDADDLAAALRSLGRKRLEGLQRQRTQHAEQLRAYATGIETPDPDLDRGFEWAKIRTDAFVADTPGVGRSLLAGYATSRPGWGDGRPGYGWYFGRDACWTAFGQLAAGLREPVREVIRFLSEHQDVSGKILHECTTSGLVHYDAADSTPLYLLLLGRYAAWTGDLDFLRKHWVAAERALHFCLETDSDGDGLIENHRVGHGWIEHGPLGGAHVTFYLAACWLAALESLQPLAEAVGRPELAELLGERAQRARDSIEKRFLSGGEYALALDAGGAPRMHRTAMLSVPLLLGAADPARCQPWLDAIAGPRFSTGWGVRMIADNDPLFDPAGYHLGAVWPLYTGWVSLAEWRAGRSKAGLDHLAVNARLHLDRARGAFDEVLHGREYRSAGVCPDQAWSAAMVLLPVVQGLWGVEPGALEDEVTIRPWLPPAWPRMALRRLRVGRTVLDLEMRRRPSQLVVRVVRRFGPGIHLRLAPRLDHPPLSLTVDDQPLAGGAASFPVRDQHEVLFSW